MVERFQLDFRVFQRNKLLNARRQFGKAKGAHVGSDEGTVTFTSAHTERYDGTARLPGGPLHVKGAEQSPGVKRGGTVNIVTHTIDLQVAVDNIPQFIEVDVHVVNLQCLAREDTRSPHRFCHERARDDDAVHQVRRRGKPLDVLDAAPRDPPRLQRDHIGKL